MGKYHDREEVYRWLWDHCDRRHFIALSQQEVSAETGISYQRLSEIYLEFQAMGRMRKYKNRFQIQDPDTLAWDADYRRAAAAFRASRGR